jgi:hypothetical protein
MDTTTNDTVRPFLLVLLLAVVVVVLLLLEANEGPATL